SLQGCEHERYYVGKSAAELKQIVQQTLKGAAPAADRDIDHNVWRDEFKIDPYKGSSPDYHGLRAAVGARDHSLATAVDSLRKKPGWTAGMLEKFRVAAIRQVRVDFELE